MSVHTIAVLPGDGIGAEVMAQALTVLNAVAHRYHHQFTFTEGLVGGAAFERFGSHFPKESEEICRGVDAILFGAVGGPISEAHLPKWKSCEANSILALRKAFQFNANYRPAKVFAPLASLCPLRADIVAKGIDVLIIRELVGDIYFGAHHTSVVDGERYATDLAEYTESQVRSVARLAFEAARLRRRKVTSVDKANVLDTSKLWRTVVQEVHNDYRDVALEILLVDNCAMQLIMKPHEFDVIVTSNLFGDILSDEAAVFPGSLGLTPSASINAAGFGMYEPSGGSAPDIAGKGIANPIAQILSAAMMLSFSFGLRAEAEAIEGAVLRVLTKGLRTKDLFTSENNTQLVSCAEMGEAITQEIGVG